MRKVVAAIASALAMCCAVSSAGSFKTVIGPRKAGSWALLASYKAAGRTPKSKTGTVRVHV